VFGTDVLLQFTEGRCDLVHNNNDIVNVSGSSNLLQRLTLLLSTELGDHPFKPTYGVEHPIGRGLTDDVLSLYGYFIRQALLKDPGVQDVRNVQITYQGGAYMLSADVKPISAVTFTPMMISLR
jgi:hypothetical protein